MIHLECHQGQSGAQSSTVRLMSDELKMDDLVIEAYGTVTLPPGWHFDANGEPAQDEADAEATQHEEGCE